MHDLQTIYGATYSYDPNSAAVFYGEADADAFAYDDGVTYLSACGCPAETGCQCGQKIRPMTTAAASSGSRRTLYRTMYTPPATATTKTPLAEIRAGVERVRREMAAQKEGREVRRRARNEIARTFEYLRQNPVTNGYSEALARQHGSESEFDIYEHGAVPCPYTLALGGIFLRRTDGTVVRLPQGDDVPQPYTLALEARRLSDRKDSGN